MKGKTIGEVISSIRKEKGMTQNELASKMNVTDKAVSKWERNLSCPDINTIPKLAQILGISVDELLNTKKEEKEKENKMRKIINIVFLGIGMAMGISVLILSILKQLNNHSAFTMLGIGLSSIAIYLLATREKEE